MDNQALEPWRLRKRLRGQCSSSAMGEYDVFLNHRGPDVKAGFIAHLAEALRSAGLNPFLDKTSLREGDPAFRSIQDALEVAKVHVAVVSKGYAESKHCLSELVAIMRSGKPVIPVFYDMEPVHLRWVESGPFAAAFEKHKSKKSPAQVAEWRDALRKLADITGFCFRLCDYMGDEAELKQKVVDSILSIIPAIEALEVGSQLVGVKEHVNTCVNKLEKTFGITCLLGLVGMGGIGKTSLAKEIYNHFVGQKKFQAMSFLEIEHKSHSSMDVESSSLSRLQKQLLWDLLHVPANNMQSYKYWFHKISSRGPILVVLDDIHDKDQFDKFILDKSLFAPGSCIVLTSRDQHLLKAIGGEFLNFYLYEVTSLESDDSQKLFNLHAFHNEEAPKKLKAIANDVSKACGGLPLALKVVGSNLFEKRFDEDLQHIWLEAVDALKGDFKVMGVLKWSYDCLSEGEKLMFVDIACVFNGWEKNEVLQIWNGCKKCSSCCGCGTPYTSLRQLIDKSLVAIKFNASTGKVLTMHGLLQDLGQSIGMADGSHLWEGRAARAIEVKNQGSDKVRALNLANCQKNVQIEAKHFAKMINLHFLILDGCDVHGDLGSLPKELRLLRWRYMPLTHIPLLLNLSNLTSLDFSNNTKLATLWSESDPALEACPNLLSLDLSTCKSITTLPDSIGRLSRLQVLALHACDNLQKLPTSIGQLTALRMLSLIKCESLEALPETVTALPGLQQLFMDRCSSISKLPTTFGLMTSLTEISIDLATEWQAAAVGQFNAVKELNVTNCTDEATTFFDGSGAFRNLDQLSRFLFYACSFMTKLPGSIGLLTNLEELELYDCEKVQELPNSIEQLKVLRSLALRKCSSLESLPESLGALTRLRSLSIVHCTSITALPTSIARLSSLWELWIEGCRELQPLPDSMRQLTALRDLTILDCGSLEGLGALGVLQGLNIWGCTSITELPGSCLMVFGSEFQSPDFFWDWGDLFRVPRDVKELQVVETNDCGFLRHAQDTHSGRIILQRIYNLPYCKPTGLIHLNTDLAINWQAVDIGQFNALTELRVTECTDEAITVLDGSGAFRNLEQLSEMLFYECSSMTKLPETIGLLTNLHFLGLYDCEKVKELPNSIGQFKVLTELNVRKCSSLETLPDALGTLTNLQVLWIGQCASLTKLPKSICQLTSLLWLRLEGCGELQSLPDSLRHLNALQSLLIQDCGSLEDLGALGMLQGLRIWGCTSITELPGSCLSVLDNNFMDPNFCFDRRKFFCVSWGLKELQLVESNDCGFLRHVQETESGRIILQRVHNVQCCKLTTV